MYRFASILLVALMFLFLPAQPAAAQGKCRFCDTNLPPNGDGGGRPNNGPVTSPPLTPGYGNGNGAGGNGNGNNGVGGGNGGSNQIALTVQSDINFGRLVKIGDGIGSVLIDLQTGSKTIIGNLDDLGGMSVQGRAVIQGIPMRPVRVDFPASIIMRDPAGGEAELRNFVTDLSALPMLDTSGTLVFHFTGTLFTSQAIAVGGNLRGRVPIQVSYD